MRNYPDYIKPHQEIRKEFEFSLNAFSMRMNDLDNRILNRIPIPGIDGYYGLFPYIEVETIKEKLKTELNRKFVLELTASFEARIVYYVLYIAKRRSAIKASYNRNVTESLRKSITIGRKHLMYQHIIPIFKDILLYTADGNQIYADFVNLINYRNWLAHGRGWDLEPHLEKFDFQYSWQIISSLFELIPDYPDNLKN